MEIRQMTIKSQPFLGLALQSVRMKQYYCEGHDLFQNYGARTTAASRTAALRLFLI